MPDGQLRMIETVARANPNTVVVLLCGCAVECPWADDVRAILYMGLPGQAGGGAAADLLFGEVNPGGKLAESWPVRYEDVPSSDIYDKSADALYMEGLYVGCRYYDKAGAAVRWPFGFGLSYTSFAYSELKADGNTAFVTVKNTGDVAGSEVVQLYVEAPQGALHRPIRELRGFKKVFLKPGESAPSALPSQTAALPSGRTAGRCPPGAMSYTSAAFPPRLKRAEKRCLLPPGRRGASMRAAGENPQGASGKGFWGIPIRRRC